MTTAPATAQPASASPAAPAVDPAAATPQADPAAAAGVTAPEQPKAEGAAPEAKPEGAAKPEGEKAKADEPAVVPDKYELPAPEGMELDQELLGEFETTARELGLSQENAAKLFGIGTKLAGKLMAGQVDSVNDLLATSSKQWEETSKADKEFGGDALDANLAVAKKALDTFGTPELRQLLNDTGLGNHPELVRYSYRVGKGISEDGLIRGGAVNAGAAKPFYSNSQMNR